ncbi:MAG: hypothetical protein N4A35_13540 [Flavobacteriales bacterium]|jgi:hypothetical protein|nr:hypothetical protein [Flavobacteriales bacterium]
MKHKQTYLLIATVLFSMVAFLLSCENNQEQIQNFEKKQLKTITPLTNSWDIAIPNQTIPEGLVSLSAKSCGACHQEHYQEWQHSTHSHAWTDPQFQAEIAKESSPFMCINCHIPLQNQQKDIVTGLINGDIYQPVTQPNPHFDEALQQEGINCASCHVRDGAVLGPTGTNKAPHKTVKDTLHLSENLCISCHNAVAVVTPQLACTFETGDEWKAGPYFGEQNCKSCHMPDTTRSIVPGYEPRNSRQHYFMGSGIPKFIDQPTKMLNGLLIEPIAFKPNSKTGDTMRFNVDITNKFAGHKVPTGDPERFIIIEQTVYDKDSTLISQKRHRIGEEWEWYPEAKKISDNNLLPNEKRAFSFDFVKPNKKDLFYQLKVSKHRSTPKNKAYNKLPEEYPIAITIFEKEYPLD